jgi:hypothetical protein
MNIKNYDIFFQKLNVYFLILFSSFSLSNFVIICDTAWVFTTMNIGRLPCFDDHRRYSTFLCNNILSKDDNGIQCLSGKR